MALRAICRCEQQACDNHWPDLRGVSRNRVAVPSVGSSLVKGNISLDRWFGWTPFSVCFFGSKSKHDQKFLCCMGSLGKFECVSDKGRRCCFLSPRISFRCVSFPLLSTEPEFLVFPQKKTKGCFLSNLGGSGDWKSFLKLSFVYDTILKYAFLYLHLKHNLLLH